MNANSQIIETQKNKKRRLIGILYDNAKQNQRKNTENENMIDLQIP